MQDAISLLVEKSPPSLIPLLILGACLVALGSAYTAQYLFGLEPCPLCLYQRIPYALAGFMAVGAWLLSARRPVIATFLVAAMIPLFLGEAALAFYHVGVEQHWWTGTASCSGQIPPGLSVDDLLSHLSETPTARCDQISWSIFGLSVTVYNVALGLALALFATLGVGCLRKGHSDEEKTV